MYRERIPDMGDIYYIWYVYIYIYIPIHYRIVHIASALGF